MNVFCNNLDSVHRIKTKFGMDILPDYLTLGTSLRNNFSFFTKSKMAAGGQKVARRFTFVGATN